MVTPADPPLVLLVEDDEALRLTTRLVLEKQGFAVLTAIDGVDALTKLADANPDIAVVDVMMPRMDGITFVRKVREQRDLGVVMLTARDLPYDQMAGFDAGADDYVVKPFDGDVLAARIRAVLRRTHRSASKAVAPSGAAAGPELTRLGDLDIDRDGMIVSRSGVDIPLSATEFRLLLAFVDRPGRVLTREQLLDVVWGSTWGDPHVVEVNIARLRAKIGASYLHTVRGVGYKLVRP